MAIIFDCQASMAIGIDELRGEERVWSFLPSVHPACCFIGWSWGAHETFDVSLICWERSVTWMWPTMASLLTASKIRFLGCFLPTLMAWSQSKCAPVLWSAQPLMPWAVSGFTKSGFRPLQRISPVWPLFRLECRFAWSIPTQCVDLFSSGPPVVVLRLGECEKWHGSRSPFLGSLFLGFTDWSSSGLPLKQPVTIPWHL